MRSLKVHRHLSLFGRLPSVRDASTSATTSSSAPVNEIVIPKRINRSPTDILYALSATVGKDYTAAHYKYHDDPYLTPMSNVGKRTFAMAQEAGRKAAKWIRQEHGDLFQHNAADPPIQAFFPTMIYTEESDVNESSLQQLIASCEVSDAIFVYNLMVKKNIEISPELRQSFLEFICFYNHEDTLSEDLIEERWFSQSSVGKERIRKTWKDGDLAESIFLEIEPKDARAYGAMIRGMCKFHQVERAYALYQEALEKDLPLDVNTFNAIIQVVNFLKEGSEMRWELTQEILRTMAKRQIKPNLSTLNATLSLISSIGNNRLARSFALRTMAEFKNFDIKPSLATWYNILTIFCRERGPISHVLIDILNQCENKSFSIENSKDTFFFVTAMDVCRNHLNDKHLAKRLNKLLQFGNNYDLIGDSYKESIYYRHFFGLLVATEPFDKFMSETYNVYVPNIYTPEPGIMAEILKQVDINGALDMLPRLWSDMVIFDHTNRESLLCQVLKIMVDNLPNKEIPNQIDLDEKFAQIGWQVWTKIEEQSEGRTNPLNWTGQMLGDILTLCCRAQDYEKASKIFTKLDKEQHSVSGTCSPEALQEFVQLSIDEKQPSKAIAALQYGVENSLPGNSELGRSICTAMTLDPSHLSKIASLVGTEVILNESK